MGLADLVRTDDAERDESSDASHDAATELALLEGISDGAVGGLVGTIVMTAYRLPIARSLPPTAAFWEQYVGSGDAEDYPLIGLALHLGYGIGAGAVFGALLQGTDIRRRPEHLQEITSIVLGTAYGLALSVFGSRVVLGRVLDMDLDPDESLVFHVGHVVYALTLGTWIGSRIQTGATNES